MNPHAEPRLDQGYEPAAAERPVFGPVLLDEGEDLRRDLVGAARTAPPGNESLQPALAEGPVGAHAGRYRRTEPRRGFLEGNAPYRAMNHLVAHLQQVARIEERAVAEQRVGDGVRARVEGARLAQPVYLCVGHGAAPV